MHPSASDNLPSSNDECWVEAEDWLTHCYPEHDWCAYHHEDTIRIAQYTNGLNLKGVQISQKIFREWVSETDFDTAMNHLLHMNQLIHWKNGNWEA